MTSRIPTALAACAVFTTLLACSPDRLRPGPPSLTLEVPEGSTVFSPDTLPIAVFAADANGLDSVVVRMLGETHSVDAFSEVELITVILFPIPAGLLPGRLLSIFGRVSDVTGQETTVETSVTVIERPPDTR